jgi:hypothetical protein
MSLKIKCFATIVQDIKNESTYPPDGHIEIHSSLYNLTEKDFLTILTNFEKKDEGSFSFDIFIGEGPTARLIQLHTTEIFTKYAYKNIDKNPIPLINQPINSKQDEKSDFISSRYWVFQKYFFVTNRNYSKSELREVKMKIHYIVKQFEDEVKMISEELNVIGVKY